MRATVKTKVGDVEYIFTFDENEEMETLHRIAVLGNPPHNCTACGESDTGNFRLDSNKDKEANIYVNVVCEACGAKAKLGQYKAKGYFWHKFEKYEPNAKKNSGEAQSTVDKIEGQPESVPPPEDDLPF